METGGTGLGLAIVTRLVKHFHGLTHVQTKLGEGTRFTIYFLRRGTSLFRPAVPGSRTSCS